MRPGSMNGGARPRDEDDDDVTIVSAGQGDHGARPKRRRTLGAEGSNNMANADEDVAITGTIGEVRKAACCLACTRRSGAGAEKPVDDPQTPVMRAEPLGRLSRCAAASA